MEKQELEKIRKTRQKIIVAIRTVMKSDKPLEKKADAIVELLMLDEELDAVEKALNQQ